MQTCSSRDRLFSLMENPVSLPLPSLLRNPLRVVNPTCEETGSDKDVVLSSWWVMNHQSCLFGLLHISFVFFLAIVLKKFLLKSGRESREHSGTSSENNLLHKVKADIDVTFINDIEHFHVEPDIFKSSYSWSEKTLSSFKSFSSNPDTFSIW